MKISSVLTLVVILVGFCSCKKDPPLSEQPLITFETDASYILETTPEPQQKVVLGQEFTGVWCYTCPYAHDTMSKIANLFPNRIALMNVHSHWFNAYDDPSIMGNAYDFRTEDGDTVVNMLGNILSIPSGSFDMVHENGEERILSPNRELWVGYATAHLNKTPVINVELAADFNGSSNKLKVVSRYTALTDIHTPIYFNVALTENNIVDWQYEGTVYVPDYNHMHILRDYAYDPKGELLSENMKQNQVEVRVIEIPIDSEWNINNMEVIAFCHNKGVNWNVYQTNYLEF